MTYTEYELSDQHMRGLIGDTNTHPVLQKVRKEHFDAWLEAHDRRVIEKFITETASKGVVTLTGKGGALEIIRAEKS